MRLDITPLMPRHRLETSRQRTLWRTAEQSARRVRFRAVGRREIPGHAKPAVVPEWRQRLTRNQRRRLNRAGRRLLVSPWFAAGAGVVIATGAIIYTPPHAKFDFGRAIHVIPCPQAQCAPVTPQGGALGLPAGAGGSKLTAPPRPPSAIAGMTFSYQVVDRTQSEFSMQITIHAPRSIGKWELSFVIPGATNVFVVPGQARWVASGSDGGTASNYFVGTESAGYASISEHLDSSAVASIWNGDIVQFLVRGTGKPTAPAHCRYNGYACQFTQRQGGTVWSGSA